MAKYAGWPFTSAHITCRPVRRAGIVTGSIFTVAPVEPPRHNIPMSALEALVIANALEPGALHMLHQRGVADNVAFRALEVLRMV